MTLAAALAAALLSAPGGAREAATEAHVTRIDENALTGTWRRVTEAPCAARYPAELELGAGGLYAAPGGPESGAYWHGGDWAVETDGRLVIQAANDAMLRYRIVALSASELTLEDAEGCRFTYRRRGA